MKFAVIIGVVQMSFGTLFLIYRICLGIFLKMLNTKHFGNYIDMIFEWIPQQLFFFCTFGYMSFLILYKWTLPWGEEGYEDLSMAPSIIGQMIALPLAMGSTEGKPLWDMESQEKLQYNLLMISLICIPWMLLPKPIIIWAKMSFGGGSHHHSSPSKPFDKDITENNLADELRDSFNQNEEMEMQEIDADKDKTRDS